MTTKCFIVADKKEIKYIRIDSMYNISTKEAIKKIKEIAPNAEVKNITFCG